MLESDPDRLSGDTATDDSATVAATCASFSRQMIHHFFLPVILAVVTGIVVSATFFSSTADHPTPGLTQQQDEPWNSVESHKIQATAGTAGELEPSAAIDRADRPARTDDSEHVHKPAPYRVRTVNSTPYRYPAPVPFATPPRYQPEYSATIEQRRKAYEAAMQARQRYWNQRYWRRPAVQQRFERHHEQDHSHSRVMEPDNPNPRNGRLNGTNDNETLARYVST